MKNKIFPTVSFHITKPCNMACKFCYSTYENLGRVKMLTLNDAKTIIQKLVSAGVQKITFAGGEPLLHTQIEPMIAYAKELGMTTGIITNGSTLSAEWLKNNRKHLDWVGLSIDSFDHNINIKIGRVIKDQPLASQYQYLLRTLNELGYKVKVNTVINAYNYKDFSSTIDILNRFKIDRFKVLRTLPIKGENEEQWNEVACTDHMWKVAMSYLHMYMDLTDGEEAKMKRNLLNIVPEDNEAMTASYLLVSPTGELYENSKGEHTFGPNLINNSIEECLEPLNLNFDTFINRGGQYEW